MPSKPLAAVLAASQRDAQPASDDTLERLRAAARTVRDLRRTAEDLTERLRETNAAVLDWEQRRLPDMFVEAGVDSVGLPAEGNLPAYDAALKPYYHANIPVDQQDAAFAWLDKAGHGDMVRYVITVSLGKGEDATAKKVMAGLDKAGVSYETKRGVPWNTLTAFVREQVEKYKTTPPLALLGATVGQIVQLKPRKEK